MNIALIVAGGSGSRMGQDIPKQFINVKEKPILLYTMEAFQQNPLVDAICVVCLDGWQEMVKSYAKQYNITKMKWITIGGKTGQESIRNGVFSLEGEVSDDDIVIIHDGIRPLVDQSVLSDVIRVCHQYGNAVSSLPYNEQIFLTSDQATTTQYIPRESLRRVVTPQAYHYRELLEAYRYAFEHKIGVFGSSYTNTMMVELGKVLHFSAGSEKNIKLTTKDDIELFKAYLDMEAPKNLK